MEIKEMTCIRCPMGCRLTVTKDGDQYTVTGNTCRRGEEYGIQDMSCPMRVSARRQLQNVLPKESLLMSAI